MPCTYYTPEEERRIDARHINKLTRMLCSVLSDYNKRGLDKLSPEVQEWWKDHQERDRRREAAELKAKEREKLAQKAKSKLTPAERKALGV